MGSTANYQIPYPELTDPPDGPAQIKALADRVDALLATGVPVVQAGSFTGGPTAATAYQRTVTFVRAFTITPSVTTNIVSGAGATLGADARGAGVSATGFTYTTLSSAALTFSVLHQWIAALPPATPLATGAGQRSEDGWHSVTATCRNPECPKCDVPVTGILIPDDPEFWSGIYCGVCDQPITDIVPS